MQVIFHDFEYADSKNAEGLLWSAHTYMNTEYRNILGRLVAQNQVVQKRKLEKLYRDFMKTSQSFYRTYIQRLSGRFYIPELRQAAQHLELEPTETPLRDASIPQRLREMLVKSCHNTLNHLGDLARYRSQASDKLSKTAFETALAYYCLANIVDPDEGTAHHQMAVLYRLSGQHLDIVYHFHRSISIAKAHPLALENLEKEYRSIRTSQNTRRPSAKNPFEALITWFVRLHSFYFDGTSFSQQQELEEEVLHRLELAMKTEGSDASLLKIILINIAAYSVGKKKITKAWTENASRHCQFVLLFIIRNIRILLRLVKEALQEDRGHPIESEEGSGESPIGFGPILMNLLPFLRIYLAWMYSLRADLVVYRVYLEDHITVVYRLLADVLPSLNCFVAPAATAIQSQYLLAEDTETMGLSPLNDQKLPLFFCTRLVEGTDPPETGRVRKPTRQVIGRQYLPHTEAIWRIRDIVCCGALLAGTADVPLGLVSTTQGGAESELWTYVDGPKTPNFVSEAGIDRILSKLTLGDVAHNSEPSAQSPPVGGTPDAQDPGQPALAGLNDAPAPKVISPKADQKKPVSPRAPILVSAPDLSEDSEMVAMVNNLVDPSEESRPTSSRTQAETSYGMDSSIANEIFGGLASSPAQQSPVPKSIPSLPWNYFYTPQRPTSQGPDPSTTRDFYKPRTASAMFEGFGSPQYAQSGSPWQGQVGQNPSRNEGHLRADAFGFPPTGMGRTSHDTPGDNPLCQNGGADAAATRKAAHESLASALYEKFGTARANQQQGVGLTPSPVGGNPLRQEKSALGNSMSPVIPSSPGNVRRAANYMERPGSRLANSVSAFPGQTNIVDRQPPSDASPLLFPKQVQNIAISDRNGLGVMQPPPGSWETSAPPINSNAPQNYMSWLGQTSPATRSSLAFSNPSNLFMGTPGNGLHQAPTPQLVAACNGDHSGSATTLGRNPGQVSRDDSAQMHFPNPLKEVIDETVGPYDSYEKQMLQASVMDGGKQPRPNVK